MYTSSKALIEACFKQKFFLPVVIWYNQIKRSRLLLLEKYLLKNLYSFVLRTKQ